MSAGSMWQRGSRYTASGETASGSARLSLPQLRERVVAVLKAGGSHRDQAAEITQLVDAEHHCGGCTVYPDEEGQ